MSVAVPKTVALLDACVLYPPSLRDLLIRVAIAGIYEPRWTEEIHAEWIRNVLSNSPGVMPSQLERTRRLMNQAIPNCLVSGYERHIPVLNLPDADDRHVLAAAIEARAAVIVTYNLSDFPAPILQAYGVRPAHPDLFLSTLFDDEPSLFLRAIQMHREALNNPSKTMTEYIQTLRATSLKGLALRVEASATTS